MARYTPESKERVREAVDMVDLVSSRTELRRSGADSYTGLCPFHEERTPSFGVKPSEKVFFCFGCQAAGDAFTFVMDSEGVDFRGALELLADRYGVPLELEAEDPVAASRRKRRERLLELLERACSYYERYLWESSEARRARDYLTSRGLEEAILRDFRVGYAPSAWDRMLGASRRGGFADDELLASGLAQRSRDRPGQLYDRFRGRITFPLCDARGQVLGFGARAGGEGQMPKYLNSPDNDVYHKGRHVFGTHLARAAAAKLGNVVVCEGYTDVIAMHQAGLANCVGLMGTALTEDQLAEIGRLAPIATLALDADSAGQEAMLRAARLAARRRIELRVMALPPGSDPAELAQRDGREAIAKRVAAAQPFVRFRVERALATGDTTSANGRDRLIDDLREIFVSVERGAMRLELERLVAERLQLPETLVGTLLAEPGGARETAAAPASGGAGAALDARERGEHAFLALCVALPEAGSRALAELDIDAHFTAERSRRAAAHLREHLPSSSVAGVEDADLAALLAELAVRAASTTVHETQLEVERLQLVLARLDREIAAGRAAGRGGLTELAAQRRAVRAELESALTKSLEETAPRLQA